jgi:hypothetical protein
VAPETSLLNNRVARIQHFKVTIEPVNLKHPHVKKASNMSTNFICRAAHTKMQDLLPDCVFWFPRTFPMNSRAACRQLSKYPTGGPYVTFLSTSQHFNEPIHPSKKHQYT